MSRAFDAMRQTIEHEGKAAVTLAYDGVTSGREPRWVAKFVWQPGGQNKTLTAQGKTAAEALNVLHGLVEASRAGCRTEGANLQARIDRLQRTVDGAGYMDRAERERRYGTEGLDVLKQELARLLAKQDETHVQFDSL